MPPREAALRNVGPGPDPLAFADLDADFAVVLLHRDYYCSNCRQQVRRVERRYDEFEARNAEVVSVLPDDEDDATEWARQYGLPFPVVADPEAALGDRFDQPRRYGLLGKVHDVIGRMPATVVLDLRGPEPEQVYAHRGSSPADRPTVDDLLSRLDRAAAYSRSDASATEDGEADTSVTEDGEADASATGEDSEPDASTPEADLAEDTTETPDPVTPDVAPDDVEVRVATGEDVAAVMQVLQGALLDVDFDTVREAVADGDVLVATDDGWVVGALVLDGTHVEAVAVRRERRSRGIGSALVEAAAARTGRLTADFRSGVRDFWADLGFEIEQRDDRLWGERRAED